MITSNSPLVVRYAALMRPPESGAVPRDGLLWCGFDEFTAPSGHHAWGWAEYSRYLTDEEVRHYDMEYIQSNEERKDKTMKRISIDGGLTFCTPEEAISHVVFDDILAAADTATINAANEQTPGGSIFDLLHKYLELAQDDLILG